ncbi:hypothetical protein GALMADRAFT_259627 [Galerina marginata CBS 339.88]|uniref:C2H2-type domain-containing protein n=1 Tax=Galerina marginata (strain CBS 339.88) TaxID=685588 RepID=A0A067S5T3_GALM3|nr:hypothetical protein GALMADRAFT_259627 [Galerina marginata CBS 339.88]
MPVVKTPSVSLGHKSSPYDMSHYSSRKAPIVRIHSPSSDGLHFGYDLPYCDGYDDSHLSLSQWMNAGPVFSDSDLYESAQCPPSFASPQFENGPYGSQEEPLDTNLFSWPYEATAGYDSSFSTLPEPSTFSNTFSPSFSVVSCSPRSESLSLSPQPNLHEYSNAFNFNFTTSMPHQFPSSSSSSSWSQALPMGHSPRSSISHSPTASCSSLDTNEAKPTVSRDPSPVRAEVDPQQQRRRFPCVIIGCERRFTSQYTLKVHMEAHKPKPRSSFPCTLGCSERFSRQHDRLRHEVAKHGKICEFSCDECGRFFSTKKTLGNHKCPVAQGGTRWVNN